MGDADERLKKIEENLDARLARFDKQMNDRDRVQEALHVLAESAQLPRAVREAAHRYSQLLHALLAETLPGAAQIHRAMLEITTRLDGVISPPLQALLRQTPRYVVGYLLMKKLASKFGALCVPYAVVSASNVTYDLEQIANSDLARVVQHEPQLNMNTRFALLTYMTAGRKNDITGFLRQARDELGFAPPFALKGERG